MTGGCRTCRASPSEEARCEGDELTGPPGVEDTHIPTTSEETRCKGDDRQAPPGAVAIGKQKNTGILNASRVPTSLLLLSFIHVSAAFGCAPP
eukprot:6617788-Pyramimonas_sp.AAC.1